MINMVMDIQCVIVFLIKSRLIPTFFYIFVIMKFIRKYLQKKRLEGNIYKEFEKALMEKNFERSFILSKRFLKIK